MTKQLLLLTCAVGALASLPGIGNAAAATGSSGNQSATEVGAVIVTAEKREQNVQKVPVAVTAITKKERDTIGIETLQDMTNFTPGMTYTSVTDHLYVRGVGRQSINLAADAGVSAYMDGFYNPDPVIIVLPTMFIGSTEVLRGPQGTLSGRNGIAGSIQVTSTRPTSTPYAEFRETVGNYGTANEELAVSGPVADGLNMRVAGFYQNQSDGYFNNAAGGPTESGAVKVWYVEAAATARLGDNADLFVKAFKFGTDDRGGPGARAGWDQTPYDTSLVSDTAPLSFNPAAAYGPTCNSTATCTGAFFAGAGAVVPGSVVQTNPAITGNPAVNNRYSFSSAFPESVHTNNTGDINAIFTYHFPSFDVKYTGGYQQYVYNIILPSTTFGLDTDVLSYEVPLAANPTCAGGAASECLTVYPQVVTNYTQSDAWWSHELNFASTAPGPVQWIGGLYYYDERYSNPIYAAMGGQAQIAQPVDAALGVLATPNPSRDEYGSNYTIEEQSKAVYGQVDWNITKQFKLTGGLRYTDDHKFGTEYLREISFGGQALGVTNLGTVANPINIATSSLLAYEDGAAMPALDLTRIVCASANASTNQKGVTSQCAINPVTGYGVRGLGDSSDAVTGTAGIEWTPDADTLGYIRYSRGYKELGFNAGSLATIAEVAPEHMNDYEVGLKRNFGRNLVVDAALFYEDYIDGQFPVTVLDPTTNLKSTNFLSIPKARSDGFELETIWTPIDHLQFLLSYALDDSAFLTGRCSPTKTGSCYLDVVNPNLGNQSIQGNELPNSPKNKISLNGNYTFVFDPGSLTLSATYLWRDQQYGSIFAQKYWVAPSWDQVDLRATWRSTNDKYELVAYGANVFNSNGYPSGATAYQAGNGGTPSAYSIHTAYTTNPPATYGVEFHYKFF